LCRGRGELRSPDCQLRRGASGRKGEGRWDGKSEELRLRSEGPEECASGRGGV
jgi:hypothetical protein